MIVSRWERDVWQQISFPENKDDVYIVLHGVER